jgi:L-asparaginase II
LGCPIVTDSPVAAGAAAAAAISENAGTSGVWAANPVLADVVRSGFVESRHRGSAAVLAADGGVLLAAGSAGVPMFPRSSNKPFQAVAMLRCGLKLDGELLALAAASHSGEDFHVSGVRAILASAGLTEDDLQCPPDYPLDEQAQRAMIAAGADRDRIHMNCSGKHAAMLATCAGAGWPTESYRDPEHPLQLRIRDTIAELAGEPVAAIGVDGCGAPLMAISLTGLARAFRAVVLAEPGSPERAVADAMRAYPEWTSGTARPERALMLAVPGLLLKSGAEGVEGLALRDGRACAFKIDDGAARARVPVTVALLRQLGAEAEPGVDIDALSSLATGPVYGGGELVGGVTATGLPLRGPLAAG